VVDVENEIDPQEDHKEDAHADDELEESDSPLVMTPAMWRSHCHTYIEVTRVAS
jgi:hypothetical protein